MPGLIRGMARTAAVVGVASSTRNRVNRRQGKRYAAEDQAEQMEQQAQMQQQAPMQAAPPQDDTTAQLEQLAQLKNQGILTEEEFAAKKAQILGI